jgi:uncharacterized protein (TIGR03790 family)
MQMMNRSLLLPLLAVLALSRPGSALEPKEVFLLVNKNLPASKEVAEHYCQKRGVPLDNIILLDVPTSEDIGRQDYNTKIVAPVRSALKDKKNQAKVLLSIYGVPLRVAGDHPNDEERERMKKLEPAFNELKEQVDKLKKQVDLMEDSANKTTNPEVKKWFADSKKTLTQKQAELAKLTQLKMVLSHAESVACVDSELMLLWWDHYYLARWQLNLLYWQVPEKAREGKPPIVMTCRLDGPTPEIAKGLVDQAVEVEKTGLTGKVYVDARGLRYDPRGGDSTGYTGYDESMREMAALLEKEGKMSVVLYDKEELFKPGSCPECALYCGWYANGNFVDCCRFVKGAVAWHLASSEAISLREPNVKYWCKNFLDKGVAATLGPVAEPYTIGFPKPEEFFGFLATGKYTLVEAYARTEYFCSWMTVLVGDPLYNPFVKKPRLKEEQVLPSPKGSRVFGPK